MLHDDKWHGKTPTRKDAGVEKGGLSIITEWLRGTKKTVDHIKLSPSRDCNQVLLQTLLQRYRQTNLLISDECTNQSTPQRRANHWFYRTCQHADIITSVWFCTPQQEQRYCCGCWGFLLARENVARVVMEQCAGTILFVGQLYLFSNDYQVITVKYT